MKKLAVLSVLLLIGCSNSVDFAVQQTSQEFAQDVKYNRTVDVLFIIDNGTSMNVVQQQLRDQIPYLFQSLKALNMDINVATTSTTMHSTYPERGRLLGTPKYISTMSPKFLEDAKAKVFIGETNFTLEEGLDAMEVVLSDSYQATEGKGFLRDGSFLNVIVLSNEDDSSSKPWKHYAEFLDKLRPNHADGTKSWALNFFGITSMQDSCSSSEWGDKFPGYKLMQLVDYSGGVKGSICGTELYKSVSSLKSRIIQILTDYKLNKLPREETIKVYVNGNIIAKDDVNGWSYIKDLNLVRFNGTSVPAAEAGIRVDFQPLEAN